MNITELHQLPAIEKLKIIELLWGDLVNDENDLPGLSWHETELKKTEEKFLAGDIDAIDWQQAKKALRSQFELMLLFFAFLIVSVTPIEFVKRLKPCDADRQLQNVGYKSVPDIAFTTPSREMRRVSEPHSRPAKNGTNVTGSNCSTS